MLPQFKQAASPRPGVYDPNWHLPKRNEDDDSPQIPGCRTVTAAAFDGVEASILAFDLGVLSAKF